MLWTIVTCSSSRFIIPAQKWLFNKYAPSETLQYIDVGDTPLLKWGTNVANQLPRAGGLVFGLDDYLPTSALDLDMFTRAVCIQALGRYDRFELGYSASKKRGMLLRRLGGDTATEHVVYGPQTPYSVSCQFSIWRPAALRETLEASTDPWNFEKAHTVSAACFREPVFRWIEESALSKRWAGKINVNGLAAGDVDELVAMGFLDESKLINRTPSQ